MKSGIYEIRNTINGKRYIGSAVNIQKRWNDHRRMLVNGAHHSLKLQRAWVKYGESAFEFSVVEVCERSDLIQIEQRHIDARGSFRSGYNMSPTAGSTVGVVASEETRAKQRAAKLGRKLSAEHRAKIAKAGIGRKGRVGQPLSEEHKAKLRGRTHTDETKARMSATRTGMKMLPRGPMSEEHKAKISAANKGRKKTREHVEKVADFHRGRTFTDEHRHNLSLAKKGRPGNKNAIEAMAASRRGKPLSPESIAKRHATRCANRELTGKY